MCSKIKILKVRLNTSGSSAPPTHTLTSTNGLGPMTFYVSNDNFPNF